MSTTAELQARIAELEAAQAKAEILSQVSRDLNAARDEDELLQALARPGIQAKVAAVTLMYIDLDEAGEPEWLVLAAARQEKGQPESTLSIPMGSRFYLPDFPFSRLWMAGPNEPQLIADVATSERLDENLKSLMISMDIHATAIIPLTQAGSWVGVLILTWDKMHEFSEQETQIYCDLISLAAPAVESRRLMNNLEQIVAERASELAQSQQMLQFVLDAIPVRVFWKDKELNYLGCNPLFAHDAGLDSTQDIVGKSDFEMGWAEQAEEYHPDDLQVIESGEPKLNYEEPQTTPTGEQIWLRMSKIPMRDAEGNVVGILCAYDDISDIKQAEEERQHLQQQVIEAQQLAIQELSTPVIPIMDRILVLPLVGSIDSMRARHIMRTLLQGIREHRAKIIILDITGVPIIDSGVATHMDKTIQAARLKGARTIITGVSDAVAEAIVDLGIDWSNVETLNNLQTGLKAALSKIGLRIVA